MSTSEKKYWERVTLEMHDEATKAIAKRPRRFEKPRAKKAA